MTDNIEKIVQEAECVAAADEYFKARAWLMDTNDSRRIFEAGFDRAYALLSKLRAPVADEPPGGTRWPVLRAMARNYTAGKHTWDALDAETCEQAAEEIRHLRAALASAPVAREAQPVAYQVRHLPTSPEWFGCDRAAYDVVRETRPKDARALYAAPQASEAVRDARGVLEAWQAVCDRIVDQYGGVAAGVDFAALGRANRAALSAQPGAQEVDELTAEQVRALLDYDPSTGLLYWRKTRTGTALAGTLAGSPHPDGYVQIKIKDKPYLAHRLAWLITNGKWPTELIDHRDGDRTNNRLSNLRDVSSSVNQENRRTAQVNNKTGFLGVARKGKRWEAKIRANGKKIYLGRFDTPEAAHAAYVSAKRALHQGCTI